MDQPKLANIEQMRDMSEQIARRVRVSDSKVLMFRDFTDAMTELLTLTDKSSSSVLVAGHASPDVEIAVDRAGLKLTELLGSSPFCSDCEQILEAISTGDETVYLANPNRITGATFPLSDLKRLAERSTGGSLIIDEYGFDFYGITGVPLLDMFPNVILLRSFAAGYSIGSHSGFAIARPDLIHHLKESCRWQKMSASLRKMVMTTLSNDAVQGLLLKELHDESLRVATVLTRLGIQNRITPTDFLLIRVADPKRVGNFLAANRTPIENLDGYPGLKHYVWYTIQSRISNDNFLTAFQKMPAEFYRMNTIDKRFITLRRHSLGESAPRANSRVAGVLQEESPAIEIEGAVTTKE